MTVPSKGRQWKRCGIYCIYAKYGHVARYVDYFLSKLVKSLDQLVIVANGELDADSRKRLERFADRIIVRENKGLDIAAYRQALLSIGWSKLAAYDEVICLNDTILGPVFPFSEMFETMDGKNVDFWGITAYPHDVAFGEEIPTHLQSYWHAYRKSLITSKAFQRYWETMPVYEDYAEATRKHEMTFTKRFADLGFTWASYIDYDKYRSRSTYPMLYDPVSLIRDDRCPVFKKRSFFVEYQYYFNQTAGQPGMELLEYLCRHTDYDTDLIWDAYCRHTILRISQKPCISTTCCQPVPSILVRTGMLRCVRRSSTTSISSTCWTRRWDILPICLRTPTCTSRRMSRKSTTSARQWISVASLIR